MSSTGNSDGPSQDPSIDREPHGRRARAAARDARPHALLIADRVDWPRQSTRSYFLKKLPTSNASASDVGASRMPLPSLVPS